MTEDSKKQDLHGTEATTRWVHKHRTIAKWLAQGLVVGATALSYYLKKQEKKISEEEKKKLVDSD